MDMEIQSKKMNIKLLREKLLKALKALGISAIKVDFFLN
jgi:hypothetical protein